MAFFCAVTSHTFESFISLPAAHTEICLDCFLTQKPKNIIKAVRHMIYRCPRTSSVSVLWKIIVRLYKFGLPDNFKSKTKTISVSDVIKNPLRKKKIPSESSYLDNPELWPHRRALKKPSFFFLRSLLRLCTLSSFRSTMLGDNLIRRTCTSSWIQPVLMQTI